MKELEKAENGCYIGYTMRGKQQSKFVITCGGNLQNLKILWNDFEEPSEEVLLTYLTRRRLSLQVRKEKEKISDQNAFEEPNMVIFECIRIVANL